MQGNRIAARRQADVEGLKRVRPQPPLVGVEGPVEHQHVLIRDQARRVVQVVGNAVKVLVRAPPQLQHGLVHGVRAEDGDGRRRGVQPDARGHAARQAAQALEVESNRAQAVLPSSLKCRNIRCEPIA